MRCGRRPVVDQVGRIHGPDASCKIPTRSRAIRWGKRRIRCGEDADRAIREKTVGAGAIHVHVAHGHIVENAARTGGISVIGVAGAAAVRTILRSRQLVIDRGRIALRASGLLVDQRLNTSHDRRCKRSPARARPRTWIGAANSSAILRVRPTENVEVAPQAVRGEKRNVRRITHTVVGIAEYGLPRRFRPAGASAADNTAGGRSARRALAGPATSSNRSLQK